MGEGLGIRTPSLRGLKTTQYATSPLCWLFVSISVAYSSTASRRAGDVVSIINTQGLDDRI